MKRANIAIVEEPPLRYCGWDVTGNIILANEHFRKKIANVFYNEYQSSRHVIDNEDFDEPEFTWEEASDESDTK